MRRWTAAYRFRYSPIISFERRRLALLDWVEQHVDPVSFRDGRDEVGISLSRGVRIRIGRSQTMLEDGVADLQGVDSLWPMIAGLLETMEPRDVVLHSASIAWSSELPGWIYDDATRTLATRVTGLSAPLQSGVVPTDVAPLVDFTSDRLRIQAEYGVVNPPELRARLNDDDIGKIKGRSGGDIDPSALVGLPETMLFVDTSVHSRRAETITDQAGMQQALTEFQDAAREVAEAVVATALIEREIAK